MGETSNYNGISSTNLQLPFDLIQKVHMFAASGLSVRFLRVIEKKLGYTAIKWVRYLTQAGSYQYRI